jgi:3-oxoacyl-[acyl-carrier-protein] synthase II
MKRRVVVTGIGAVAPNGIGREAYWQATREGVSGVKRISRFDPQCMQVQIAGEVSDFDEDAWVAPKDRPHISRAALLAIAATKEAIEDANLVPSEMNRDQLRRVGVYVGSGGCAQDWTRSSIGSITKAGRSSAAST